jgi:uncharacterized protein YkwD
MKQQTFWKLKSAITLLILLTVFFLNEKISSGSFLFTENKQSSDNFAGKNKSIGNFDDNEDEIFALVNEERLKKDLNALNWDDHLSEIARNYSKQMARENFFDHFDPKGADIVVRAKKSKLRRWDKIGENLFYFKGESDYKDFAVRNWMKSPTHRQNILDKDFNTAGIGIAESGDGEIFITQVFIRR